MNSKQKKTLNTIFTDPVNGNLEWRKIESLFATLNAEIIEGRGSRITILLKGVRRDFHRPHPGKEALRYRVIDARELLIEAGEAP